MESSDTHFFDIGRQDKITRAPARRWRRMIDEVESVCKTSWYL